MISWIREKAQNILPEGISFSNGIKLAGATLGVALAVFASYTNLFSDHSTESTLERQFQLEPFSVLSWISWIAPLAIGSIGAGYNLYHCKKASAIKAELQEHRRNQTTSAA